MKKRFIDRFSVILLDMGNTFMFDCDNFGPDADYAQTYRSVGGTFLDEETITRIVVSVFAKMDEDYRDPALYDRFGSVRDYLRPAVASIRLPEGEEDLLETVFALHEIGRIPSSHAQVIQTLSRTHALGVISNVWSGSDVFREEFKRAGIGELFSIVVFSSDHGCIKPSGKLFDVALKHFGEDPKKVLFVGDNYTADILGAKNAGLSTVWIHGGRVELHDGNPRPDRIARSLRDILDM